MTDLHSKVHKLVHRIVAGAASLVGFLQAVKAIDLSALLAGHTVIVMSTIAVAIAALEALPVVVKAVEDAD